MTIDDKEANLCFQGHDECMEHSESNINKYVGRIICPGKKKLEWKKDPLKSQPYLEPIVKKKKILHESGQKTFSKKRNLQGNMKEK